ncbi:MAG: pseudouridine synthase [Treponema sp.]
MQKIKIVRAPEKDFPFAVAYKPAGLPSAPLKGREGNDAFSLMAEMFPELKTVRGKNKIECGLLHRLDTDTRGLLMAAATQDAYDFMQDLQKNGGFIKTYRASCRVKPDNAPLLGGFPPVPETFADCIDGGEADITSFFRNYGAGSKTVRPVTDESGKAAAKKVGQKKAYTTRIKLLSHAGGAAELECAVTQGFRHQVRCHCAWLGFPIIGDRLYNADCKSASEPLRFAAVRLEFMNPVTGEREVVTGNEECLISRTAEKGV